jgi:serine/threonine protein kinase
MLSLIRSGALLTNLESLVEPRSVDMNDVSGVCLHCCLPKGRAGGCGECGPRAAGKEVEGHPMFLPPGTILRHQYLIGRVLGFGGFGVTYLGLDLGLDMRVAIKEFLPTGENLASRHTDRLTVAPYPGKAKEDFAYGLKKFIEEGRALARFTNHPNVVSVLSFFEAHGTAYLVMSFIEGVSLDEHLKRRGGPLPESEAVQIITMVLDGLKAVHREGLLHRDISPDNIFLSTEGTVQLIDFGSARSAIGRKSTNISKIVKAGYSPFEQYRADAREAEYTDLYAVSATLYRCLTGARPPEAMDRLQNNSLASVEISTDRLLNDPLVAPAEIPGVNVSAKISNLTVRGLEMFSADRFQTADEMLSALCSEISEAPVAETIREAEPVADPLDVSRRMAAEKPVFTGLEPPPHREQEAAHFQQTAQNQSPHVAGNAGMVVVETAPQVPNAQTALQPIEKLRAAFFVFVLTPLLVLFWLGVAALAESEELLIVVLFVAFVACFGIVGSYLWIVYEAHRVLKKYDDTVVSPAKAAWLLLVPVWSLIWMFQVIHTFSRKANVVVAEAGGVGPKINESIALSACVAMCGSMVFPPAGIASFILLAITLYEIIETTVYLRDADGIGS